MAPRSSVWDHKSDRDLLLNIIELGTLKSIMWPTIADKMKQKGYSFTHEACRQHFQKIRKESRAESNVNDDNSGGNSPVQRPIKTPKKKTPASTPKKATGMTQNGSFTAVYGDGEDDEEDMSHSFKRKRAMKSENEDYGPGYGGQTANVFKVENLSDPGGIIDLEHDDLYEQEYV